MTSLDDHPTPTNQPPPPGGPRRAWLLLWATLATWREVAAAARRRHGPRTARAGRLFARNLAGAAVALVLALWLWGHPLLRAAAASTRWAETATAVTTTLRARRVTLSVAAAGVLCWLVGPFSTFGLVLLAPVLAWTAMRVSVAVYPHTTRGRVRTRYGRDGFAGFWELRRHLSAHAVRQVAPAMRPSIAATLPAAPDSPEEVRAVGGAGIAAGARARRLALIERLPVTDCGTWLGRSAVGPVVGIDCYAAHKDSVGLVAAPQTGKTALIGHHILDHAGAVVSTSTKPDLYLGTAAIRALIDQGAVVDLFNPEGLGGLLSTLRWSPVRGCRVPRIARRRAGHMIGALRASSSSSSDDQGQWADWAAGVLASLLIAADRAGETMATVAHWAYTQRAGAEAALRLLEEGFKDGVVPQLVIDAMSQVTTTEAKRTRDAIFLSMRNAVAFMAEDDVAAVCCPTDGDQVFDVAAFIASRSTLYLLGADDGVTAPLLAALTGEIFETAKTLAGDPDFPHSGKGRLDPALMLALDEAALITPVPLERWLADAGGRGIHIIWAVQSLSQLADTWGERGAQTILNATNATLFYGGTKLDKDLDAISKLCGTRLELVADPDGPTTRTGGRGHARFERVPVVPPDRVRTIPQWHALLVHRASPVTIVRMFPYWDRADVRRGAGVSTELRTGTGPLTPDEAAPTTAVTAAEPAPVEDPEPFGPPSTTADHEDPEVAVIEHQADEHDADEHQAEEHQAEEEEPDGGDAAGGGDIYGVDHLRGGEGQDQ